MRAGEADVLFERYRETALVAFAHVFPPERYPFPHEAVRDHWRQVAADPLRDVTVAEVEGDVVGAVVAAGERLENLFVVPSRWGSGVADALHDAAVAAGTRQLDVMEENARARRFYERHGWRLDGRREHSEYPPFPALLGYELSGASRHMIKASSRLSV